MRFMVTDQKGEIVFLFFFPGAVEEGVCSNICRIVFWVVFFILLCSISSHCESVLGEGESFGTFRSNSPPDLPFSRFIRILFHGSFRGKDLSEKWKYCTPF